MVGLKLSLLAQAHDAPHGRHRAPAGGQDRAQQQHLRVLPDAIGKVRRKRLTQAIMRLGRGRQRQSSWSRVAVAYPAFVVASIG